MQALNLLAESNAIESSKKQAQARHSELDILFRLNPKQFGLCLLTINNNNEE